MLKRYHLLASNARPLALNPHAHAPWQEPYPQGLRHLLSFGQLGIKEWKRKWSPLQWVK